MTTKTKARGKPKNLEVGEFQRLCNSQTWQSAVAAYLMQRTLAEVTRERVDAVHREILEECPIYADRYDDVPRDQILRSRDLYLCSDEALCQDFYDEADHRLRARGLKPADMPKEYCPALVAEHDLTKIEWFLIDEVAGPYFGIDNDSLLCGGLEARQKFIDLIVGAVVNSPNFRNPLTKTKV